MSSGPTSGAEVIHTLIQGGEKAVRDFAGLSGGDWFDEAPEYFLTTYLANCVKKLPKATARLEVNVDKVRKVAGANRRGRPTIAERRNGRFDIVVYWANDDRPRFAVEVKSPLYCVDANKLAPDFERLCKAISANTDASFQFSAFIYYASVAKPKTGKTFDSPTERLRVLVDSIHANGLDHARKHDLLAVSCPGSARRGKGSEDGAWCVSAVVFLRKPAAKNLVAAWNLLDSRGN